MKISDFKELANLFIEKGYDLYLVGGSVRDYLLHGYFSDADLVTNASISEVSKFLLLKSNYKNMESGKFIFNNHEFDITTMRKESGYDDFRHPSKIEFVSSPKEEYSRRDFTINALYMDKDENIYDYVNGLDDLKNKVIKCIGNPYIRLKEDPLRILRAIRFASTLDFNLDQDLLSAIKDNKELLCNLKFIKIKEEINKFKIKGDKVLKLLTCYELDKVIPLIFDKSLTKSVSYINYSDDFVDILNDIVNKESFINVIKVNSIKEIKSLKDSVNKYISFVRLLTKDMNLDALYSQGIFIIVIDVSNISITLDEEVLYINKKIEIKTKDDKFYEFKNKKQRNKLYYESFINLLKE